MDVYEGKGWTITKRKDCFVIMIQGLRDLYPQLKELTGKELDNFIRKHRHLPPDELIAEIETIEIRGNGWRAGVGGTQVWVEHNGTKERIKFTRKTVAMKKKIVQTLSDNRTRLFGTVVKLAKSL